MIETNVVLKYSHKLVIQTQNPNFLPAVGDIIDLDDKSYVVRSIRHKWVGLTKKRYQCKLVVVEDLI